MLKYIAYAVGALVVLVAAMAAYAATKPDTFRVQRSATIKAPPEKIAPLITDFHRWTAWSPYEKMDSDLKRDYGGAPAGKGATYAWDGDRVGAGRMEILDASNAKVLIDLEFLRPFKARNKAEFLLEPDGDATRVTWAMEGQNVFIGKVMSIFMDMDKMIGKDFEAGLASMKAAAEA